MTTVASFAALLRDRAATSPATVVHIYPEQGVDGGAEYTYASLDAAARVVAARIAAGCGPGARVVLLYPPGPAFAAAFFGCLYAGAIAVPLPLPTRPAEIARLAAVAANARPALVLTTAELSSTVERVAAGGLGGAPVIATDRLAGEPRGAIASPDPDDVALLQYTSGSTGAPKGVMVTHGNLVANSAMIRDAFAIQPGERGVGWLPHFHDMGLIGNLLQPIYSGFPMVLVSPVTLLRNPLGWLQLVSRHRATLTGGPNFAYELCVRRHQPLAAPLDLDLSRVRLAFTGAEPVRSDTLDRFADTFGRYGFRREAFYPCYGLAEATLLATGGSAIAAPPVARRGPRRLVGNGWARGDGEIRIVDPATHAPVPDGVEGEIWIRGSHVARGYWADADTGVFGAALAGTDGPGYLRSGDLGLIDGGELFVTGRMKDLIIIRGQNHYPQDIEASVERAHAAIRPGCVAVFAIEIDGDERLGVVAEVRPEQVATPAAADEVVAGIRARVAADWDLRAGAIALVPPSALHKTSSGKVQRASTRAAFVAGRLPVLAGAHPQETRA